MVLWPIKDQPTMPSSTSKRKSVCRRFLFNRVEHWYGLPSYHQAWIPFRGLQQPSWLVPGNLSLFTFGSINIICSYVFRFTAKCWESLRVSKLARYFAVGTKGTHHVFIPVCTLQRRFRSWGWKKVNECGWNAGRWLYFCIDKQETENPGRDLWRIEWVCGVTRRVGKYSNSWSDGGKVHHSL